MFMLYVRLVRVYAYEIREHFNGYCSELVFWKQCFAGRLPRRTFVLRFADKLLFPISYSFYTYIYFADNGVNRLIKALLFYWR